MNLEGWLHIVPLRIRSLFRRGTVEDELDEELHDHLERGTEEGIASGLSLEEARRAALLELGGIEQRKEECRDMRGVRWLEEFFQDIRYGVRLLRKNPRFSAVVILALALGLGANTALFSLFNSVLLAALPVRNPEELVVLNTMNETSDSITSFSYPMYREFTQAVLRRSYPCVGDNLMLQTAKRRLRAPIGTRKMPRPGSSR